MAEPGAIWSDLVELAGISHQQPLHWRLLDGAHCRFAGSQRQWRIRLIPLGVDVHAPSGFELLLIADEALAGEPVDAVDAAGSPDTSPTRLVGTALTPVLRQPIARIIANAKPSARGSPGRCGTNTTNTLAPSPAPEYFARNAR